MSRHTLYVQLTLTAVVVTFLSSPALAEPRMTIQPPYGTTAVLSGSGFPAGCWFYLEAVGAGDWSNRVSIGPISVSPDGTWGPWNFNFPALAASARDFLARGQYDCASTILRAVNTSDPYPRTLSLAPFDPRGLPQSMTIQQPVTSPSQIVRGEGLQPDQYFTLVLGDVATNYARTDASGRFAGNFYVDTTPGLPRTVRIQYDLLAPDLGTEYDGPYPHRVTLDSGAVITLEARPLATTIAVAGLAPCDYGISAIVGGNYSNRQYLSSASVDWSGLFTTWAEVPPAVLSSTDFLVEGSWGTCSSHILQGSSAGSFPKSVSLAPFDPSKITTMMTIKKPEAQVSQVIRGAGLPAATGFLVRLGGVPTNYVQTDGQGSFAGNFGVGGTPEPPRTVELAADDGSRYSGEELPGDYPHLVQLAPSGTLALDAPVSYVTTQVAGAGFPPDCDGGAITALPAGEDPFAYSPTTALGFWNTWTYYPPGAESATAFRWDGQGNCDGRTFRGSNPGGPYPREIRMTEVRALAVSVDVKPGSCLNPINMKSNGVVPVAVLGGAVVDVAQVDQESIRLEGVSPLRASYQDVASPSAGLAGTACPGRPDGVTDLVLHFSTAELRTVLQAPSNGTPMRVRLTGQLLDGTTAIEGSDLVVLR